MEGKTESELAGERYLAHLAHELRAPLNAIIGYADAMRAGVFGPMDDRYGEYADIIHAAGRHMMGLAEDLLERARIGVAREDDALETFDAGEPVAWALRLLRLEAEAADVTLAFEAQAAMVTAERRAIVQMVVNLVANALHHAPRGSTVRIAISARGPDLELTVLDEGPGFAPNSETRGLGLGLVRELAAAHGGMMEIASAPGQGSAVTVILPIAERRP